MKLREAPIRAHPKASMPIQDILDLPVPFLHMFNKNYRSENMGKKFCKNSVLIILNIILNVSFTFSDCTQVLGGTGKSSCMEKLSDLT